MNRQTTARVLMGYLIDELLEAVEGIEGAAGNREDLVVGTLPTIRNLTDRLEAAAKEAQIKL